ncbi:hypothetical protein Hanom_Chr13g01207161 [Helianthus anomalus]
MALAVIQDDEGFNWNKHIPNEGSTLVEAVTFNRDRGITRIKMNKIEEIWMEARDAKRWDAKRQCLLDPEGNIATDPKTIDFKAFVKTTPC